MSEDEFAGCEAYPDGIPRQSCTARSTTSRPTPVDQGLTYLPRDPEARWTSPEGPSETSWVADGLQQTSADAPAGSTKGRSERRKRPRRCSRDGVLPPPPGGDAYFGLLRSTTDLQVDRSSRAHAGLKDSLGHDLHR